MRPKLDNHRNRPEKPLPGESRASAEGCTGHFSTTLAVACLLTALLGPGAGSLVAQPVLTLDLASVPEGDKDVLRVFGSQGSGRFGVPVAGGHDVDGDGFGDIAVAFMTADPLGRTNAGEVDLVFTRGFHDTPRDTAADDPNTLRIFGEGLQENAGSEIWMDDVTGDGLGDLLICRQNYTTGTRCGVGALSIIPGSGLLRTRAASLEAVDLAAPPANLSITTLVGRNGGDRFCIWARTGDVDGDGIADIAVGADQEDTGDETHRGGVYVFRGGAHLAAGTTTSMLGFGSSAHPLDGLAARILPPEDSTEFHTGGTCQIADLDGSGRSEVIFAATLSRAGASLQPDDSGTCIPSVFNHSTGGSPRGTVYIAWADNFPAAPAAWPAGFTFDMGSPPGSRTILEGEARNDRLGEELLGGRDWDGDGNADLFLGDLVADGTQAQNRSQSGLSHVIFDASSLVGEVIDLETPPPGLVFSRILGPRPGSITADTALEGDFDADGHPDLAFSSPHDDPAGRISAGSVQILYGRQGSWPALIDLAPGNMPSPANLRIAEVWGRQGTVGSDTGDTLAYSGAPADLDADGHMDLVVNEMVGNGFGGTPLDVGNLIVISGRAVDPAFLFADGFESAGTGFWDAASPP